jgi:hypothetical protein
MQPLGALPDHPIEGVLQLVFDRAVGITEIALIGFGHDVHTLTVITTGEYPLLTLPSVSVRPRRPSHGAKFSSRASHLTNGSGWPKIGALSKHVARQRL